MRVLVVGTLAALGVVLGTAVAVAQSPPPPTPVPPSASPSPFPTALATPEPSRRPPKLSAASAVLVDLDTGQMLLERSAAERRAIASTTKIMTALLLLEAVPPGDIVTVSGNAAGQTGAEMGLEPGERITVKELLFGLMLASANDAAVALAEHVAGSVEAFLERMNDRVHQLGLRDSRFESPNGLDDDGYSTARDLAAITVEAYRNPTFEEVVRTRFARIPAPTGPDRVLQNRNALLWLYPDAIGVKTGFTSAAGFCLVAAAERDELRLGAVVLGAPADAFSDAAALLEHGFATFERRMIVEAGEPYGDLRLGGKAVPVRADITLELLLRRGQAIEERVIPEPGLRLPVTAGERVGLVAIRSAGERLATVPLVAARSVAPAAPAEPERAWWQRAWDAVARFLSELFRTIFG